ncbi:MAG: OmpH family outer membrane protein [Bacteroidales bacterium]|nr:OmpH family outer membrane protein [Bacteroidales bacterium]MDE6146960.1 OmpH family outer membrane protein [Bacteroidales bacterium]
MKHTSSIFSALLLGAVVVFGAASCAGNGEKAPEATEASSVQEQSAAKGAIVYIDMTVLMADYDMANDLRAVVETKVQNIQAEISRREKKFTSEYNDFQEKMQKGLLTRSVAEEKGRKLQQQEIDVNNYANQKNAEINEELMVMNNQINDAILTFIKKYNEEKQYSMILISQGDDPNDGIITLGTPVLAADPSLDITADVLARLNDEYIKSKNQNNKSK